MIRFDTELWKRRRIKRKIEQESLIDLFLYPFDLFYDFLDCWRLK